MTNLPELLSDEPQHPFAAGAVWGDLVFSGGHVAGVRDLSPDFATQADQAMAQLEQTLEQAGAGLDTILRLEAFLASREHFAAWNAVYDRCFPRRRPPRTTLVAEFVSAEMLFEVQAVAARRPR